MRVRSPLSVASSEKPMLPMPLICSVILAICALVTDCALFVGSFCFPSATSCCSTEPGA